MGWWSRICLVLAIALVVLAVVPWRDFQSHPHWDRVGWIPFVSWPVRPRDVYRNVMLFVPLGAAVALNVRTAAVIAAAAAALALSLGGELTQVYSHGRFPSATDVCANVSGAVAAASLVALYRKMASKPREQRLHERPRVLLD